MAVYAKTSGMLETRQANRFQWWTPDMLRNREVCQTKHMHSDAARTDGKRCQTSKTELLPICEKQAGTQSSHPENRRRKQTLQTKRYDSQQGFQ